MKEKLTHDKANCTEVIIELLITNILIITIVCLYMGFNDPHEVFITSNNVTTYFLHKHDYVCYIIMLLIWTSMFNTVYMLFGNIFDAPLIFVNIFYFIKDLFKQKHNKPVYVKNYNENTLIDDIKEVIHGN